MGMLYKRGRVYWCKYYVNGRPVRESTGQITEKAAERVLKVREGRVAAEMPMLPRVDRIRYEEIAEDLRQHYAATGSRDPEEAEFRLAHLGRFFAGRRVAAIGAADGGVIGGGGLAAVETPRRIDRALAIDVGAAGLQHAVGDLEPEPASIAPGATGIGTERVLVDQHRILDLLQLHRRVAHVALADRDRGGLAVLVRPAAPAASSRC